MKLKEFDIRQLTEEVSDKSRRSNVFLKVRKTSLIKQIDFYDFSFIAAVLYALPKRAVMGFPCMVKQR